MADLKPANENPWYVLSTLYGEQTGDNVDWELAGRNTELWNIWSCQALSDAERAKLKEAGAEVPDAGTWDARREEIETLYQKRMAEVERDGFVAPELPDLLQKIDMSATAFSHTVVWEKAVFGQFADFKSATFTQSAYFRSATFAQPSSFISATFAQDAYFSSAKFTQIAEFSSALFTQSASFSLATFTHPTRFYSATFSQDAQFNSATFTQVVNFSSATFAQSASFSSATFAQFADFTSATFTQYALFSSVTFAQVASFASSKFAHSAYFSFATFEQAADFSSATFEQAADFSSATFSGFAYFRETRFGTDVRPDQRYVLTFSDAIFERPTSFREAEFKHRYPELDGTVFHDKTQFTAEGVFWPQGSQPDPKQAKEACAVLRHVVAKQSLPEDEGFFFRKEMRFAGRCGPKPARPLYWLYGLVSNYGHSVWRPVAGLAAVAILFFPAFQGCLPAEGYCVVDPPAQRLLSWKDSAGLSLSNMFKFFGFQTLYFREFLGDKNLSDGIKVAASVQTGLSFVLLFFLGLGLRSRFRLR